MLSRVGVIITVAGEPSTNDRDGVGVADTDDAFTDDPR